jgi:hypothetical protein
MIQQVSDHDLMMMKMMPFPHGLSFREAEEDGFCQEPSRGLWAPELFSLYTEAKM